MDRLIKDEILSRIDTYQVINHYLSPYHNHGLLKQGQHISNPFQSQIQRTPSFNIYQVHDGNWRYKDFATGDDGDLFDLIQNLFGCDFSEALQKVQEDFLLGSKPKANDWNLKLGSWNSETLKYWEDYGIGQVILSRFKVYPIESFTGISKNGKEFRIQSQALDPIFGYKISDACYKMYRPKSGSFKFSWLGIKPHDYVFGLEQLPRKGDQMFITGGEKDVLTLASQGFPAISFNSETATPPKNLMEELRERFNEINVLYDNDDTGLKQSKKMMDNFGVNRWILPSHNDGFMGKDVSDFVREGFDLTDDRIKREGSKPRLSLDPILNSLLLNQAELTRRKAEEIRRTPPILTKDGNAIIFPRTINIIQGKAGVHKSRLAETICSAFIRHPECKQEHLGLRTNLLERPTVCYVDTERNLSEQFPYALQQILVKGGYRKEDTPNLLQYISLLSYPRAERFEVLKKYLGFVRERFQGHLVLILDVVTDCIRDFNRAEDSMQLIDLMNSFINEYNVTFIGLIHENPGNTDKARGHLGTELMNKASTVMQVGFVKGKNNEPTDLISLNFLKTRSTKRYDPIFLEFCQKENGLVLAESSMINDVMESRKDKAVLTRVIDSLEKYQFSQMKSQELLDLLSDRFDCTQRTVKTRLSEIMERNLELTMTTGEKGYLRKKKDGKEVIYFLSPVNIEKPDKERPSVGVDADYL